MAYSPTTWVDGTTPAINALNLNNMETGIGNALLKAGDTMTGNLKVLYSTSGSVVPNFTVQNSNLTLENGTTNYNVANFSLKSGNGAVEGFLSSQYQGGANPSGVYFGAGTNHDLFLFAGAANRMTVLKSGLVGIGTSPSEVVDILKNQNGGTSRLRILNAGTGDARSGFICGESSAGGSDAYFYYYNSGHSTNPNETHLKAWGSGGMQIGAGSTNVNADLEFVTSNTVRTTIDQATGNIAHTGDIEATGQVTGSNIEWELLEDYALSTTTTTFTISSVMTDTLSDYEQIKIQYTGNVNRDNVSGASAGDLEVTTEDGTLLAEEAYLYSPMRDNPGEVRQNLSANKGELILTKYLYNTSGATYTYSNKVKYRWANVSSVETEITSTYTSAWTNNTDNLTFTLKNWSGVATIAGDGFVSGFKVRVYGSNSFFM